MLKFPLIFVSILLYLCNINLCEHLQKQPISRGNELQNLAGRSATLLVSTIDGYLNAIDAQTGIDKWRFKEGPVLESPVNVQRGFTFIPDPRDGQLYFLSEGRLNKLPFTIPHLVRVSPCKSSDGVFYAGHKKDVWISLNPETGERMDPFAATSPGSCPANHAQAVHIGKTEYQIQMMDTKFKDRHWNATFVDYSSHLLPEEADYALQHFTSTNDGRVMTVDSNTGFVLWQRDFGNVIVNMYLLKGDGMHRLPSIAIGRETFDLLAQSATLNPLLYAPAQLPNRLFSTLYVGECPRVGLYALPAFVDERTNRIGPKYLGPPLLEGPNPKEKSETEQKEDDFSIENNRERQLLPPDTIGQTYTTKDGEFLILGYHQLPKGIPDNELFPMSLPSSSNIAQITFNQKEKGTKQMPNTARSNDEQILASDSAYIISEGGFFVEMFNFAQRHPYPFSAFLVVIIALCIVFAYLVNKQRGLMRHRTWSSGSTLTAISETGDASRSSRGSVYTAYEPVDLPAGWHRVNNSNLSYNSEKILGRGCEGTFVYLGKFDDRKVAVKRIVSANLERGVRQQIEREVMHLRQSDTHPNVIRYFCSETDQHFHYIALEFCNENLEQLIGLKILLREDKLDLLKQTADGIAHLHRINIVHRDVKPKNILIIRNETMKDKNIAGQIRVKISDFGLCKSIKLGHNSISKVSGVVGTEGWMAPELFSLDSSVTYAVDVFSLGCVFYYVLTDGQHPFGESLSRMNNIKFGIFSLDSLDEHQEYTSRDFIQTMIRSDNKNRPVASAVAAHPLFWDQSKQLQFLMEVSDWIEKKDIKDPIMRRLEWKREKVVGNWLEKIDELLKQDLMKQRHYMNNLRDLLRSIRNKKHHYQELSPELRALLGSVPNDYLAYFTTRFPRLLMHTFMAMTVMGKESVFKDYYQSEKLREFYERERSRLILAEPERRSASPANWRTPRPKSHPVVPLTALAIVNQQNIIHAPPFDPSIPPPEIPFVVPIPASIKVADSPQSDDPIDGKQNEEGFSVPNNPVKNGKPKKTRRKKRKAPFALLMTGNDDEEEEANIQGEEEIEMSEENIKNINDKRIN